MKKQIVAGIFTTLALFTLAACGDSHSSSSSSSSNLSGKIIAGGSTALQPLVQEASTEFMTKNPNVQVSVQGGGSGVGLTQVAAGNFQIGNSDIYAGEKSGIDGSKLTDHKIAVVGFAAIVNKSLAIDNLSTKQLTDIFTGKITNWKDVGGPDLAITVIERPAGSGTRVNFDKFALGGATEQSGAITQDSSGTVVTQVGQTKGAISYVALSYASSKDIKALKLDDIEASEENIVSNHYKVWSYEHMYTLKDKTEPVQTAFIKSVASNKKNLEKMGYIAIDDMKVERSEDGKVSNK